MTAPSARARLPLFVLVFAILTMLAPAAPLAGYARTIASTARALVATGTLDVAPLGDGATLPSTALRHGRRRATSGLGAALALVPAEALAAATRTIDPTARIGRAAEAATAGALVALVCVVFFGMLVADGLSARAALFFTLALAFATPLAWYGRVPDGTALATLLLLVAARAARAVVSADVVGPADRRAALALGLSLGALVVVEPTLLFAALVLVAWCGLHRYDRLGAAVAARVIAPLAAGLVAVVVERWHAGALPEPRGELLQGLDGLVLSTGKSLFLYAPVLLLAPSALLRLWRTHRAEAQLVLAVAAAVLLAAAARDDWHGDPTWGPRRAVPLVPLALEAIALAWSARATERRGKRSTFLALLIAVGIAVQTAGITISPSTYLNVISEVRVATGAPAWFGEAPSECHFIPQFSPIIGHAWLLSHLVRHDRRFDVNPPYLLLLSTPPRLDNVWSRLFVDWFAIGWPPLAAIAWLAALAVAAAAAAWTLRRRLVLA
ncbi:MAG TPA: hypothetical protein VGL86_20420 [Polyangia bacterium]